MKCPNCGAPIDFAGGTDAICSFCRSKLQLSDDDINTGVLKDQPERQWLAEDADRIRQLMREGTKIDAIKLLRARTGLGLREAKAAVEAIERGETPDVRLNAPPTHGAAGVPLDEINKLLLQNRKIEAVRLYRERTGVDLKKAKEAVEAIESMGRPMETAADRSSRRRTSALGCLPVLLFIGLLAGAIVLSGHVIFRAFGPLGQALQIVNSDPAVAQALGRPITPGVFVTGEMGGVGGASSAELSVSIRGPKRDGEMKASGVRRRGLWDLSIRVLYDEDGRERSIFIRRTVR
ncbi:MAG: hypothetical protein JXA20_18170 [Spirochaetes bacterium]|nr:hypothetical protein [Spirochaetota bacterium]